MSDVAHRDGDQLTAAALLEAAMVIIAHANGGTWGDLEEAWDAASKNWRDSYYQWVSGSDAPVQRLMLHQLAAENTALKAIMPTAAQLHSSLDETKLELRKLRSLYDALLDDYLAIQQERLQERGMPGGEAREVVEKYRSKFLRT